MPDNPPDPPEVPAGAAPRPTITAELDARGLRCPEPLMVMRNRLRDLGPGEVLRVQSTDPSTERDFRDFCRYLDHELLAVSSHDDVYEFLIRKGGA